jgi:hypothetical protein
MIPVAVYSMVGSEAAAVFDLAESDRTEKVVQRNVQFLRDLFVERRLLDRLAFVYCPQCLSIDAGFFIEGGQRRNALLSDNAQEVALRDGKFLGPSPSSGKEMLDLNAGEKLENFVRNLVGRSGKSAGEKLALMRKSPRSFDPDGVPNPTAVTVAPPSSI